MRTTVELPDELLRLAKSRAALDGISLKQFFIRAVAHEIHPPVKKVRRDPPVISTGGKPIYDLTPEETADAMFGNIDDLLRGGR